ncbi:hypothetical protein EDD21DRAFT_414481 [Dissophora ornata]|nr:hypothetical protein EDD21DRAFT_414481 [Dissophora ornata]
MHALDIPEIRWMVGQYLAKPELLVAVAVCKSWNASFSPLLFSEIKWTYYGINPSAVAVLAHASFIRVLRLLSDPTEFPLEACRNLEDVQVNILRKIPQKPCSPATWERLTGIIHQNPRLRFLNLSRPSPKFLTTAFSECTRLSKLGIGPVELDHHLGELLLTTCLHLEKLRLESVVFADPRDYNLGKWAEFSMMRALTINLPDESHCKQAQLQLQLIWKCSQLQSLSLGISTETLLFIIICGASESIGQPFPPIDFFELRYIGTSSYLRDNTLALILESVPSSQILTSCRDLKEYYGNGLDLQEALKPNTEVVEHDWICMNLTCLSICIYGLGKNPRELQKQILKQLSRMDRLEYLSIGHDSITLHHGVKLNLNAGLEILGSLRRLHTFCFSGLYQEMEEHDIRWIVLAWPMLRCLNGILSQDLILQKKLEAILTSHGVHVNPDRHPRPQSVFDM